MLVTVNNPLYPELSIPPVLVELLTFLILTPSPTLSLCAVYVTTTFLSPSLASVVMPAIILGLRL